MTPVRETDPCSLGERSSGRLGRDRGSATVLMAGVVAVALVLFVGGSAVAAAQLASARARSAADFAALAAAGADVRPGTGEPCSVAAELARRNGGRLQRCTALGASRYEVVVTVRSAVRGMGPAVARARAGPVAVNSPGR